MSPSSPRAFPTKRHGTSFSVSSRTGRRSAKSFSTRSRSSSGWRTLNADRWPARPSERLCRALREFLGLGLARDLQSSVRLLVKDRGFTATTILTLAVCLGANAAIFTVVYSVLLRPLPVPDSDRIVAMGDVYPTITPNDILSNTAPSYFDRLDAITDP